MTLLPWQDEGLSGVLLLVVVLLVHHSHYHSLQTLHTLTARWGRLTQAHLARVEETFRTRCLEVIQKLGEARRKEEGT